MYFLLENHLNYIIFHLTLNSIINTFYYIKLLIIFKLHIKENVAVKRCQRTIDI